MENNTKHNFSNRHFTLIFSIVGVVLIFIIRLFYLQVIDNDYKVWADNNAFLNKTLYPSRGLIYDRNGKLLVYNQPAYDVMLIMREVETFDTLDFCNVLGITKEIFLRRIEEIKDRRLNPGYSSYVPQVFMNQLSAQEYGALQEKLYKFPGFYIQNRTIREYEYPYAAHVLGGVGQVNRKDMEKDKYYVQGDNSGRTGIERSYEKILRGKKGVEILLRDAHGRVKGRYEDGRHDQAPVSGKNLTLSIDIDLQAYGEQLMKNKIGGIVMIEPSTGEVLCIVSSPTFDPGILVGRQRGKNHNILEKDPNKPLYGRAFMASYPPGSTFKPAQGLVFLQEKVITPQTMYTCVHGYPLRNGKPGCHWHPSPLNLISALATSCNSYFCWGLHDMLDSRKRYPNVQTAFEVWKNHIVSMGYGHKLGIDLPGENRGFIPNSKTYDKVYGKRWNSNTIISISIGQGEILTSPLQICNLAATVANRGYFITPHVVKKIQDLTIDSLYIRKRRTTIDLGYYDIIAEGMRAAVTSGTCHAAALLNIEVCGKTGTVENPRGKDHSVFMGFAPYDNPKVAISVFVENAGFGATYAVPIGKLMLEKYLTGTISETNKYTEDYIINTIITPTNVY
ncbi:MAG: penicillin-binding protein 2 [Massilibacteroides sp.]|nr:penicillin-binding protein 2 [Massilibacteroides sp.]MDD3062747.1 penicillin-binding protein 2 [Massilibacteroides sp.]MDD4115494.1 penicillin-binding protein 2 [Massilibacteroides sp.]MDD4661311.1 penicillin-binding protein 2 [Massilibacteroides sp.]